MPDYCLIPKALTEADFLALRDGVLGSPLVGSSTLAGPFRSSRGFAITFTAAGRGELESRFAYLKPFLARAIAPDAMKSVRPRLSFRAPPVPNAWYLNALLVGEAGSVARHADGTLRGPSGDDTAMPKVVSVLYLSAPQQAGGELVLSHKDSRPVPIQPVEGALLHFRGDLDHEVNAVHGLPDGKMRASLVLEQYAFDAEPLARLPAFKLDSRAGFSAYLQTAAPKNFEIEP